MEIKSNSLKWIQLSLLSIESVIWLTRVPRERRPKKWLSTELSLATSSRWNYNFIYRLRRAENSSKRMSKSRFLARINQRLLSKLKCFFSNPSKPPSPVILADELQTIGIEGRTPPQLRAYKAHTARLVKESSNTARRGSLQLSPISQKKNFSA